MNPVFNFKLILQVLCLHFLGSNKKQVHKYNLSCLRHLLVCFPENLSSYLLSILFIMIFVKVITARNQCKLKNYAFFSPTKESFIRLVPLDNSKSPFRLDASVLPYLFLYTFFLYLNINFFPFGQMIFPYSSL